MEPLVVIKWVEAGLWLVSVEGMVCNWTEDFQRASRWPASALDLPQVSAGEGRTIVAEDPGDPEPPRTNAPGASAWRYDPTSEAPESKNVIKPVTGYGPGRWLKIGSAEDKISCVRALRSHVPQGEAACQYATGYVVALDAAIAILEEDPEKPS